MKDYLWAMNALWEVRPRDPEDPPVKHSAVVRQGRVELDEIDVFEEPLKNLVDQNVAFSYFYATPEGVYKSTHEPALTIRDAIEKRLQAVSQKKDIYRSQMSNDLDKPSRPSGSIFRSRLGWQVWLERLAERVKFRWPFRHASFWVLSTAGFNKILQRTVLTAA